MALGYAYKMNTCIKCVILTKKNYVFSTFKPRRYYNRVY